MANIRDFKTSLESRERNRMHARKTRQRKKEHMSVLQDRCAKLRNDQLSLRQSINEKNTASILLGMFGKSASANDAASASVDAKVDALMKRSVEDIPDASQIPELPALILPGQHSSKKIREAASAGVVAAVSGDEDSDAMAAAAMPRHPAVNAQGHLPDDGIDYDLLSKDRAKCTAAELDQIRRERNRMHAKRTRDRKRILMEEMEVLIKQLEEENQALRDHLASLNASGDTAATCVPASASISTDTTPSLGPASPRTEPSASNTPILSAPVLLEDNHQQEEVSLTLASLKNSSNGRKRPLPRPNSSVGAPTQTPSPSSNDGNANNDRRITVNQIKGILHTAGELDKNSAIAGMLSISSSAASNASPVSIQNTDDEDEQSQESDDDRSPKRQCIAPSSDPVPASC